MTIRHTQPENGNAAPRGGDKETIIPVQVRFTPSHGNFHIAVCSPGDITPSWMVVFIPSSGRPFSVISTLPAYSPEVISHTLSLTARLDADGYSQASIISVLAMEGAQ